jgi:hypothetical protein
LVPLHNLWVVVVFNLSQGWWGRAAENFASVGAAGGTLLDLVNLLPEEERNLPTI